MAHPNRKNPDSERALAPTKDRSRIDDPDYPEDREESPVDAAVCEPEPAGISLAADILGHLERYVVLELPEYYWAITLWVLFAHAHDAFFVSPILAIESGTKRAGKSRLLEALWPLVPRPHITSRATPASIYHLVAANRPTLLIDEGDAFIKYSEQLRGILNSGWSRLTAKVDVAGSTFSTWTPKVIALIGFLPATLQDRSICIRMQRKAKDRKVTSLRQDQLLDGTLGVRAAAWTGANAEYLEAADPVVPTELDDRQADSWRPLLAIADLLGPEWARRARQAAVKLAEERIDDDPAELLIKDLKQAFKDWPEDRIPSRDLVKKLREMPDRPWASPQYGPPLTEIHLAKMLEKFGVRSRRWGTGPKVLRTSVHGYYRNQLQPLFERYAPDGDEES